MRKIKSISKNELYFKIGRRFLKFGISEFAMITGLNFNAYPYKKGPHATRLVSTYLNNNSIVNSYELEAAFLSYASEDDI